MKNWFWRRFVILLLTVTLPLSAISMSLTTPCPMKTHSGMFDASVTAISTDEVEESVCPAPCKLEQKNQCAEIAHSCASCVTTLNLAAAAITPSATFAIMYPVLLDLASYVPPLLERPPAQDDSFAYSESTPLTGMRYDPSLN